MIRIDFHTHTKDSYDGFTNYDEIIKECKKKSIDAIAITEHDKINNKNSDIFKKNNIHLISGCEYTAVDGSHIIGLFVENQIEELSSVEKIISSIKKENGIVMIPHPFKNETGFFKQNTNFSKYLNDIDLIEIFNGGTNETIDEIETIKKLAKRNNIKIIAGSDSHKAYQIGYYVNIYPDVHTNLKETILNSNPKIMRNNFYKKKPRINNAIQKNLIYQFLIKLFSFKAKMLIKRIIYNYCNKSKSSEKNFSYSEIQY